MPFLNLDNNQFNLTTKGIDYPDEVNIDEIFLSTTQLNMMQKINKAIDNSFNFNDDKVDLDTENKINPIDCKYYTINQFSILHLNIHSLEFHMEELRIVIKLIKFEFDFICLTESKIRKNFEPKSDITIDDYQPPVGTPTEASKGGVLIYVKKGTDYIPREDLNRYKLEELESYFIEVINTKGKNTIIETIYRRPCLDQKNFIDKYMQPLNNQLLKEDKKKHL